MSAARLADVARRTSRAPDLDVLRIRLVNDIARLLPAQEQKQLTSVRKDLEQDRRQAFLTLVEALTDKRYRKLRSRLSRWLRAPRYSTLGSLPLRPRAYEGMPLRKRRMGQRARISRDILLIGQPWAGPCCQKPSSSTTDLDGGRAQAEGFPCMRRWFATFAGWR